MRCLLLSFLLLFHTDCSTIASNAVVMRMGSGDYPIVCPHLVRDLVGRGLWTEAVQSYLLQHHGMSCRLLSAIA